MNCLQVETNSGEMGSAVAEIKKLSEQLSQMRQENIALKVGHNHLVACKENKKAFASLSMMPSRYKLLKEMLKLKERV